MLALCRLSRALVPGGRTLRLACAPALKPMLTVGVGFTTFNAITSQAFCMDADTESYVDSLDFDPDPPDSARAVRAAMRLQQRAEQELLTRKRLMPSLATTTSLKWAIVSSRTSSRTRR